MPDAEHAGSTQTAGDRRRSQLATVLALALLGGTFFLISPPEGRTYPGAIPWRDDSVLHRVTELMSLWGTFASARGVEIKDAVLHLAAALGLALLAWRSLTTRDRTGWSVPSVAGYAQILLAAWVLLSLLSAWWSGDPDTARGQALLYAIHLGWAVSLAALLRREHLVPLLFGTVVVCAVGGAFCVWYYYERNPFHRPGFPLGNPSVLAAGMIPGMLVALGVLVAAVAPSGMSPTRPSKALVATALVGLAPMLWCFKLAGSRGAVLGLLAGLALMGLLLLGRRLRWALAAVVAVVALGAGTWWFNASHLDVAMARGATMRFRIYAWRYAAELWSERPYVGYGAGAYPRLAGERAFRDRILDPSAFMGEIVEHAHNELFEVFAEIGLFGGLTFVGGFVATLFAASQLIRRAPPGRERWLLLALAGGVGGLAVDAMTGVGLRLPGVAAIFFTLLGALWAACAAAGRPPAERDSAAGPWGMTNCGVGALYGLACVAVLWLAVSNWRGTQLEYAADVAHANRRYAEALDAITRAEPLLLDPVQKLAARRTALDCRFALAGSARQVALAQTDRSTRSFAQRLGEAIRAAEDAHAYAMSLRAAVPALEYTDHIAALSAEYLAELHHVVGADDEAQQWARVAERAWHRQRFRTPYDAETLLALVRYPATLPDKIALLRDALRLGYAEGRWLHALHALAQVEGFADVLARFVDAVGPITPETDVDALVASMAPETERLAAAWLAARGQFEQAARRAQRAAALYAPMAARFPTQRAVALSEQADYALRGGPAYVPEAVALLQAAIAALPPIQAQKYDELARPYRLRLVVGYLADDKVDAAIALLHQVYGPANMDAAAEERVLHVLVDSAAATGIPAEVIEPIRRALCPRYPSFCDRKNGSW